jgi:hypothetical protein
MGNFLLLLLRGCFSPSLLLTPFDISLNINNFFHSNMTPLSTRDLVPLDDTPSPEWHSGICISDGSMKDPTIADIDARRQAVGQMVAPTAAYADSDMFKLQCSRVSPSSQHP